MMKYFTILLVALLVGCGGKTLSEIRAEHDAKIAKYCEGDNLPERTAEICAKVKEKLAEIRKQTDEKVDEIQEKRQEISDALDELE